MTERFLRYRSNTGSRNNSISVSEPTRCASSAELILEIASLITPAISSLHFLSLSFSSSAGARRPRRRVDIELSSGEAAIKIHARASDLNVPFLQMQKRSRCSTADLFSRRSATVWKVISLGPGCRARFLFTCWRKTRDWGRRGSFEFYGGNIFAANSWKMTPLSSCSIKRKGELFLDLARPAIISAPLFRGRRDAPTTERTAACARNDPNGASSRGRKVAFN